MSRHSLVLGGTLDLTADYLHGCKLSVLGQDMSLGSPMPIESAVRSLIQDGAILRTQGYENAEVAFNIMLEAPDSISLAQAEATIVGLVGKSTTLEWTPPDGLTTSVYTIQTSRLQQSFDDMDEVAMRRRFVLVLTRLPWARSKSKVVQSATVAGGTPTLIDACDSLTGWSAVIAGTGSLAIDTTVKSEGTGSLRVPHATRGNTTPVNGNVGRYSTFDATVSGKSVAVAEGSYLTALVLPAYSGSPSFMENEYRFTMLTAGGSIEVSNPQVVAMEAGGFLRVQWQAPSSFTLTGLRVRATLYDWWYDGPSNPTPYLWIDRLQVVGVGHSSNQSVAVIDIKGSVRAPGSLQIKAAQGLGQVLVMSLPESQLAPGFEPALRKWKAGGPAPITDAAAMTGASLPAESFAGRQMFDVPVSALAPGPYMLIVRARRGSGGTAGGYVAADARLRIGGVDVGETVSTSGLMPDGNDFKISSLGVMHLPPTPMQNPNASAVVRVQIWGDGLAHWIDEAWLFPLSGSVTILNSLGTGTPAVNGVSSHLWLDAPSPDQPNGGVWRGASDDRVMARSALADVIEPGQHLLYPPRTRVFLVTTGVVGASVTADYFPHWHTNAAE